MLAPRLIKRNYLLAFERWARSAAQLPTSSKFHLILPDDYIVKSAWRASRLINNRGFPARCNSGSRIVAYPCDYAKRTEPVSRLRRASRGSEKLRAFILTIMREFTPRYCLWLQFRIGNSIRLHSGYRIIGQFDHIPTVKSLIFSPFSRIFFSSFFLLALFFCLSG